MRKAVAGVAALGIVAAGLGATPAAGTPSPAPAGAPPLTAEPGTGPSDDLPNPFEDKRRALRETALTQVLNGEATPERVNGSTVVQVSEDTAAAGPGARHTEPGTSGDQYVELAREQTDRVFVLLVEFGDERAPDYPDQDTDPETPGPARFDGPRHNEIPEPDRTADNTTVWQPDYDRQHYQDLYFGTGEGVESLRTYYERQSSGRYSIGGTVTDWVRVRYNEARYGRSNGYPCDANVCDNTWDLVRDGLDQWVAAQRDTGRTEAEIADELAAYDQWDRYDFDGDGDFNEPDGYIDHMQIVHSGGDQADGDPHQGEDAIWSHRWYTYVTDAGRTGPPQNPLGGTQIGDTGIWAGDYTIQPENGGLSVFAHEYGHDLGLPDHYDTAGGQNGVEWWSLMAQSRLSAEGEPLGTRPGDLSAWDKLQLGWLDYEVVAGGQTRTLDLGPHEYHTRQPQGVVVTLPPKEVTDEYGPPAVGERMWWSSSGDDLATTMTRDLDLTGVTTASLDLRARYAIEAEYDYLYVQASTDGGATWSPLDGTAEGRPFVRDGSGNPAISGSSGGRWVDVRVALDQLAGQAISLRLLYRTDGGVAPDGFFADEIVVTADGDPIVTSGAENGDEGWMLDGFQATTGTETGLFDNYYVASHRSHVSYDRYLATGPYNFGFPDRPDFAEHFSYEEGLLVSYWDTSQTDNNTSQHPGEGLILPIDAHPRPIMNLGGEPWRSRIQVYDAPFSRSGPRSFTLHIDGRPSYIRGQGARPVFDDTRQYLYPELPDAGVTLPAAGVRIRVLSQDGTSMRVRVGHR